MTRAGGSSFTRCSLTRYICRTELCMQQTSGTRIHAQLSKGQVIIKNAHYLDEREHVMAVDTS